MSYDLERVFLVLFSAGLACSWVFTWLDPGTVRASSGFPVHNVNTGLGYPTIQTAIDASETLNGHTLFVDEGVYFEHVEVRKSLTIIGANENKTIVDSGGSFRCFIISASNVNVTGFTAQNAVWAIHLNFSSNNVICRNKVRTSQIGIYFDEAENNTVLGNVIEDMKLEGEGIYVRRSNGNIVQRNCFSNISYAFSLVGSSCNVMRENTVTNCSYGAYISLSSNNSFHHNNFVDNTEPAFALQSTNNTWDDGYPSGGNYWGPSKRLDVFGGLCQNMSGGDGISDDPYIIDQDNRDNYPLAGFLNVFEAGVWSGVSYHVDVVSNSTVSAFCFSPADGPLVRFNVTGGNVTKGFCRVSVPKGLLWVDDGWNVTLDGSRKNCTVVEDENWSCLYVTYPHSVRTVEIRGAHVISEFPSALSFALVLVVAAASCFFCRKCHVSA